MADLADRSDRVLKRQVAHHGVALDHPKHQVGDPHLHEGRPLAHVRIADDHVQTPIAFGVGVGFIARVDDRPAAGGGARYAFPDVLGALGDTELGAARAVENLPCAAPDLTRNEERDKDVGHPRELAVACHEVVLVAPVGVPGRVGVVLEEIDLAADAFLVQPHLRRRQQMLQDPLARLVVRDQFLDRVAFGRRVFGVGTDVEVQARAVLEEHVGRSAPMDDPAEEVPGDLVGTQPPLAPEGARDPVFVLQPEDATVHLPARVCPWSANAVSYPERIPASCSSARRRNFLRWGRVRSSTPASIWSSGI